MVFSAAAKIKKQYQSHEGATVVTEPFLKSNFFAFYAMSHYFFKYCLVSAFRVIVLTCKCPLVVELTSSSYLVAVLYWR